MTAGTALRAGRRGPLRHALALGAAGLALAAYGLGAHLAHALYEGASVADIAGTVVGVAGLALVVAAYRLALRGRGHWAIAVAVLVTLALLQWFVLPVVSGALVANAERRPVGDAATLGLPGARDVRFAAADGTRLAGWLVPGRTGVAVVVMHGSHGTRESTADYVRLLAAQGHAVLSVDARGHGESGGDPNAAGWTGVPDVAGAVAFLRRQAGVDGDRIAGLGLSMGGEVLLRAAAEGVPMAAVVADGAGGSTLGDQRLASGDALPTSVTWMSMRAAEVFSGDDEPAPLHRIAGAITAPVLLVASNANGERDIDAALRERIGNRAALWHVTDVGHTGARDAHPREYAERIGAFLNDALGEDRDGR